MRPDATDPPNRGARTAHLCPTDDARRFARLDRDNPRTAFRKSDKRTRYQRGQWVMWIFGYGSLMFDGWETACGCIDSKWANLPGYRRSFNKKSVESRGTPQMPGLTLNLVRAAGYLCRGIAFAFKDDDKAPEILMGLQKREGCKPRGLAVQLEGGRTITAQVFIYEGRNLIDDPMPLVDKARMVAKAAGIRGTDFDYVRDTYEGLKRVGVDDPAVTALWEAIKK